MPSASEYRFKIKSDDGSRLYIDGGQVIDNDGMQGPKEKEGSIFLEAVVRYFINNGVNESKMEVSGKG